MDSDTLTSMYAQIVRGGIAKEQSQYVTDEESAAKWDVIEREVQQMREQNVMFEVPAEIPAAPGEADDPDAAPSEDQPTPPNPEAEEPEDEPADEPEEPADDEDDEDDNA